MSHRLSDIANLSVLYSQPTRFYHNLNHINWCLGELEQFANDTNLDSGDRDLLTYAIWWHDAVYNPYSKNNEAESARLFRGEVNSDIHPAGFVHRVEDMILATAHHTEDQKDLPFATLAMLDIDLAALGYEWKHYRVNGDNIKKEFAHVPLLKFFKGRAMFLTSMLSRKSIYYTNYFREKYETQARSNMQRDLHNSLMKVERLTMGLSV